MELNKDYFVDLVNDYHMIINDLEFEFFDKCSARCTENLEIIITKDYGAWRTRVPIGSGVKYINHDDIVYIKNKRSGFTKRIGLMRQLKAFLDDPLYFIISSLKVNTPKCSYFCDIPFGDNIIRHEYSQGELYKNNSMIIEYNKLVIRKHVIKGQQFDAPSILDEVHNMTNKAMIHKVLKNKSMARALNVVDRTFIDGTLDAILKIDSAVDEEILDDSFD